MIANNSLENASNSKLNIIPLFKDKPNEITPNEALVGGIVFDVSGTLKTPEFVLGREEAAAIDVPITRDNSFA